MKLILFILPKKIDFPDVIKRKVHLIKNNENLSSFCPSLEKTQEQNENIGKN